MRFLATLLLLALAACQSGPPRPVDIESWDTCARCRMAISQKRYAAEIVAADGGAAKFDDIVCMLRYAADHHLKPEEQAVFVMDYETEQWLDADKAVFVQSDEIPSPMAGGIAAARERARAESLASAVRGRILTLEELWTSK